MNLIYLLSLLLLAGAAADRETTALLPVKEPHKKEQDASGNKSITEGKILSEMNVQKATLTRKEGEGNIIEVLVTDSGIASAGFEGMQLTGSSGTIVSLHNLQSFKNVSVPFEGIVRFRSRNNVGNIDYDREVRFKINEVGKWVLLIEI